MVRVVVLFDERTSGDRVTLLTDSSYHGAILMSRKYLADRSAQGQSAGDLVHEATHNYVNSLFLSGVRVFSRPTDKLYATPPRPPAAARRPAVPRTPRAKVTPQECVA
ncbi:hypothetical protein [Streptomyces sp.]|uniref:hypothetical protein n=1 Tax=Streptomyces sp. TaxID=1931 RepID=UPI002F41DDED